MKSKFELLAAATMMMAAATDKKLFDTGPSKIYVKPIQKHDLPRWDVGGQIIFAKDAKTAEKYAKKRGIWRPGMNVKSIESK